MNREKNALIATTPQLNAFLRDCASNAAEIFLAEDLIPEAVYRSVCADPENINKLVGCLRTRVELNRNNLVKILKILIKLPGSEDLVKTLRSNYYDKYHGTLELPGGEAEMMDERNIGGVEPIHDVPDLKTVLNELAPVKHKWKDICIQLGISNSKLHEFKMSLSHDDPLTEGIDYWLKSNTDVPITWESVVAALESYSVDERGLAKTLKKKYAADKQTSEIPPETVRRRAAPTSLAERPKNYEPTGLEERPKNYEPTGLEERPQNHDQGELRRKKLSRNTIDQNKKRKGIDSNSRVNYCLVLVIGCIATVIIVLGIRAGYKYLAAPATPTPTTPTPTTPAPTTPAPTTPAGTVPPPVVHGTDKTEVKCNIIEDLGTLEKVLAKINADREEICSYLKLKNCAQLNHSNRLGPFHLADEYLRQKVKPCWETIVSMLCNDFHEASLAEDVASTNSINYKEYCSDS